MASGSLLPDLSIMHRKNSQSRPPCAACGEVKPPDSFSKSQMRKAAHERKCKDCVVTGVAALEASQAELSAAVQGYSSSEQMVAPSQNAVSREELLGLSGAAAPPEEEPEGFGFRMLRKLGWQQGSGLGRLGEGRVQPLSDSLSNNDRREGLGASAGATQQPLTRQQLKEALARLLADTTRRESTGLRGLDLIGLSQGERKEMHGAALSLGLSSRSYGKGEMRFLRVFPRGLSTVAGRVQGATETGAGVAKGGGGGAGESGGSGEPLRPPPDSAPPSKRQRGEREEGAAEVQARPAARPAADPAEVGQSLASAGAKRFVRAVRDANLVAAAAELRGFLRLPVSHDSLPHLVGFINLSSRHREMVDAWEAFGHARGGEGGEGAPAVPRTLALVARGLDLSLLLEGLCESSTAEHLAAATEVWREMRRLHIPAAADALDALVLRCAESAAHETAFSAYLWALDASVRPSCAAGTALVRTSAASAEWAASAYAVLVSMREAGQGLMLELPRRRAVLQALAASLVRANEAGFARNVEAIGQDWEG